MKSLPLTISLLLLILAGCRASDTNVLGNYKLNNIDSHVVVLEIRPDHTFVQTVTPNNEGAMTITGMWSLDTPVGGKFNSPGRRDFDTYSDQYLYLENAAGFTNCPKCVMVRYATLGLPVQRFATAVVLVENSALGIGYMKQ